MINKEDLFGLDKDLFWVDKTQGKSYRFLKNGISLITDENENETSVSWDLILKNNIPVIKINNNKTLSYYIFNRKNEDGSFSVTYKTKENNVKTSLISREIKKKIKQEKQDKFHTNEKIDKENLKFSIKNFEKSDKVFFSFILLLVTAFITLLIKLSEIFSMVSIFNILFISFAASIITVIYLREPLFYISKKYKKEINDIIIRK